MVRIPMQSRFAPLRNFLAVISVGVFVAGCGGGGGGSGDSGMVHDPSSGRAACSLSRFAPNYATGLSLSFWPQFPIHVYFVPDAGVYTSDLQSRAVTAFNSWVTGTSGQVAFTVVPDQASADVVVSFIPVTDERLASLGAAGITYFYTEGDAGTGNGTPNSAFGYARMYVGIDGDVHRENGTMAHEFGHALGIHGHSPDINDLMFFAGNPQRSDVPTIRDINTIETAYCGVFTRAEPGRSAARPHPPAPPLTAPGWHAIE